MFGITSLRKQCIKTVTSLMYSTISKDGAILGERSWNSLSRNAVAVSSTSENCKFNFSGRLGSARWMSSAPRGRSMRSKVEQRMQREAGKTLKEIRRAKRLKLKLMTEEERLIHQLRRAKKKVALLLQKLKKYELPELPSPKHDPELLTSEQLQAYKKIGFRNKNYVPVGVRGVFGGVVQNMHLHWKFHETVQVCCDNFPKEKIKEMATMLARLSGGIVVNIHNVKTIIMFRGRNYRQPKNLIPLNTLTKRKALFKARFEQALESQKLNIKKIEQTLRRKGVNPEDPVAMASIQKVAATFFNAIDQKEGSPYVFRGDEDSKIDPHKILQSSEPGDDSEDEELDKFISEIEDAADKEWVAEEAAEKEEFDRLKYWNREDYSGRFGRHERVGESDYDNGTRGGRFRKDEHKKKLSFDSDEEDGVSDMSEDGESDEETNGRRPRGNTDAYHSTSRVERGDNRKPAYFKSRREMEEPLSDLENAMFESESEEENHPRTSRSLSNAYVKPSTYRDRGGKHDRFVRGGSHGNATNSVPGPTRRRAMNGSESDPEIETWDSDDMEELDSSALKAVEDDYQSLFGGANYQNKEGNDNKKKTAQKKDDDWESD
ncbi:hypothetical protein V2J09_005867 [Rumex salicifolius]